MKQERFVAGGVFGGQDDGAAGQPGFYGIERNFGLARETGRPRRQLGVGAVGRETGGGGFGLRLRGLGGRGGRCGRGGGLFGALGGAAFGTVHFVDSLCFGNAKGPLRV